MTGRKVVIADTRAPRIAVIYTHFPHYRAPVFAALSKNSFYAYDFFYDPQGIESTISSGEGARNHHAMPVKKWHSLMWQGGALRLAASSNADGFIFLGNPFIVSTWVAAALARLRGKPVFYWTHGWLRREHGLKAFLRRMFYRLADGFLVYGTRARALGTTDGFDPACIHVINNSLDYDAQKAARTDALNAKAPEEIAILDKPFFLAVSRLVQGIKLEYAIDAMAQLQEEAALIIVGAGPEREALEKRAQILGVDVRFTGSVYDEAQLARLFMNARAVVSPGKVGLLAMHALAYGTPVITHGDLDHQMPEVEAIEDGVTGALFRYGDVTDLTSKMRAVLAWDEKTRAACSDAAIARVENGYTPEAQVNLITNALNSIFKRPS
jgi:glycosyltransferase involved in cell wall biosynthesis